MALLDHEDYKDSLYYDEKRMAEVTDEQIDHALAVAESAFLRRTNRERLGYWFEAREKTVTLHGTGLPQVRCPYPVLELTSVTVGGVDITADVTVNGGHFIYRTDGDTFGDAPDALSDVVFCDVVVEAKFGDTKIERGEDLEPVVPADVQECLLRMAWHSFRKERIALDLSQGRRSPSASSQEDDVAHDRAINQTIQDWTVYESSKTFDFR